MQTHDIENVNGYYVFKVTNVKKSHKNTLAEVKAAIAPQLPNLLYQQAVGTFVKHYRAKWIARTNCRPGYVVRKCRQFKRSPGETPEDPYTIN
jgi:hypothetical protein